MFLNIFKYILKLIFISILFLIILCVYIIIFEKNSQKTSENNIKQLKHIIWKYYVFYS